MWVTLYTDASWRSDRGSLAYWIRSDKGRIVEALSCPSEVRCNNTAEFAAIVVGVQRTLSLWDDVEGIQVNTDSQTAIAYLKFGVDTQSLRRKDWLGYRTQLYEMLDQRNCKVQFKFVKGHQRPTQVRAYINDRVDSLASQRNR